MLMRMIQFPNSAPKCNGRFRGQLPILPPCLYQNKSTNHQQTGRQTDGGGNTTTSPADTWSCNTSGTAVEDVSFGPAGCGWWLMINWGIVWTLLAWCRTTKELTVDKMELSERCSSEERNSLQSKRLVQWGNRNMSDFPNLFHLTTNWLQTIPWEKH